MPLPWDRDLPIRDPIVWASEAPSVFTDAAGRLCFAAANHLFPTSINEQGELDFASDPDARVAIGGIEGFALGLLKELAGMEIRPDLVVSEKSFGIVGQEEDGKVFIANNFGAYRAWNSEEADGHFRYSDPLSPPIWGGAFGRVFNALNHQEGNTPTATLDLWPSYTPENFAPDASLVEAIEQVDGIVAMLNTNWLRQVDLATYAGLPSHTVSSGVITMTANGPVVFDGVTPPSGVRVLVWLEAAGNLGGADAKNIIYTLTQGVASVSPAVLTPTNDVLRFGSAVFVKDGTNLKGWTMYIAAPSSTITPTSTPVLWYREPGRFIKIEWFGGSGNYSVEPGCRKRIRLMVAGGGAGGGAETTATTNGGAGGGGAAGGWVYAEDTDPYQTDPTAYTTGAAGAPGAVGNNPGGAGGDSTFGANTAKGGGGGQGMAAGVAILPALGGLPIVNSVGGSVAVDGAPGEHGTRYTGLISRGGFGGSGPLGGGGGEVLATGASVTGLAATGYGGGGGGGAARNATGDVHGGAGSEGRHRIVQFS